MAKQARLLTYEDYLHLPPDRRWELVEGVPRVVPSPNTGHQEIVGRLFRLIANHIDEHGGGRVFVAPFDAVLSDIDVFQPDVLFISDADADVLTDDNVRGNPTWVIEVLSNPYNERDKVLAGARDRPGLRPRTLTLSVTSGLTANAERVSV